MESRELHINLNGRDYHIRLTPKKTVERGTEEGKKITLGMILGGVNYAAHKKGFLEAHSTLDGKQFKDWVRGGNFRDNYASFHDYDHYSLSLNLKGVKIEINEYYNDMGGGESSGIIKRRKHWYGGWERTELKNPKISGV